MRGFGSSRPRGSGAADPRLGRPALAGPDPALPPREGRPRRVLAAAGRRRQRGREPRRRAPPRAAEEVGIPDELPLEGPVALVDSISPKRALAAKHVVHIIFAGDLSGRSLEAVTSQDAAVRGHRLFDAAELDGVVLHPPIQRFLAAGSPATRPCTSARSGTLTRRAAAAEHLDPRLPRRSRPGVRAGLVCALVGEASSGKSTVLTAIWTLLEAAAPPPTIADVSRGHVGSHPSGSRSREGGLDLPRRPAARDAEPEPRGGSARALPARKPPLPLARRAGDRGGGRGRRRALPAAVRRASLVARRTAACTP